MASATLAVEIILHEIAPKVEEKEDSGHWKLEPPLVEHARVLSSLREQGPQQVSRELRKKFMTFGYELQNTRMDINKQEVPFTFQSSSFQSTCCAKYGMSTFIVINHHNFNDSIPFSARLAGVCRVPLRFWPWSEDDQRPKENFFA